ncbi:dephospho-CoA kinase [Pseudorhodoferax sp. Leaf267]|uniref:dephospho-CoA kinase n=1 Tax=Pseudorhodoferax sp. Leaf267 TaxID=1736316 RepID=UPI0006F66D4F|nr:dephospho-CoA kinase [Pseudorhodoferax sp. Leaf267]KQP23169.1 dephospho-CoA kinase [Pseudorhodoferax sp. Leaf267]
MRTLGLTGGIGSGKSTVSRMLVDLGAALIDADANSRTVTAAGGSAIAAIRASFGDTLIAPDGALDRVRMRALVFQDPDAKRRLEAIVHPLVGQLGQQQLEAARAAGRTVVVYDIPLLVESGRWRAQVDAVLVVDCLEQTQVARVVQRSGLDEAAVQAIIAAQATRAMRLAAADAVIYNEGLSLADLQVEVNGFAQGFGLSSPVIGSRA